MRVNNLALSHDRKYRITIKVEKMKMEKIILAYTHTHRTYNNNTRIRATRLLTCRDARVVRMA